MTARYGRAGYETLLRCEVIYERSPVRGTVERGSPPVPDLDQVAFP